MRKAFIDALCQMAEKDSCIWLLTGDLGYTLLEQFRDRFPNRFVNAGVAEQNMIGVATGLALSGKTVFTYSIANFAFMRCLEQIRNDVCYHNTNVKIVAVGGGITYGAQGYTHHAVEDLAIMRTLPNMMVLAPEDTVEAGLATKALIELPGPGYLRLGKNSTPMVDGERFSVGKPLVVRDGADVTLLSTGGTLEKTIEAAALLERQGIHAGVASVHTLKPVDTVSLQSLIVRSPLVVTAEEHSPSGGLGTVVLEAIAGRPGQLYRIGIDRISSQESQNAIGLYSIDAPTIARKVVELLNRVR